MLHSVTQCYTVWILYVHVCIISDIIVGRGDDQRGDM